MTATYDGHLILAGKVIEPCCASMHRAFHSKVIYPGTSNRAPVVALRIGEREAIPVNYCPFCKASVEVRP